MSWELNEYAAEAAAIAESKGWVVPPWDDAAGVLSKLMLVVTEVAEAAEAVRAGDRDNYAEELADVVIRIMHLAAAHEVDLEQAIVAKFEVNRGREYLHGGKRA